MPARSPEECLTSFAAHMNGGNLEGLLELYEANAGLVQQDGPPARGTAAIRPRLAAFIAIRPTYKAQTAKVIDVDSDLALLYSDWSFSAEGATLAGKALHVVRRQPDGTWKIALDDPFGRH